jgi:hypothetical protein
MTTRTVPWPGVLDPAPPTVLSVAYWRAVSALPTVTVGIAVGLMVTVASGSVSGLFAQFGYGPK